MCIGPEGDLHGVSAAECAVRMAKAGSNVVGVNCHFDPFVSLQAYFLISKASHILLGHFLLLKEYANLKGL